jgi:GTP-binding protein
MTPRSLDDLPKLRDAVFVASGQDYDNLPPPAFVEIAFAGRSNVGKSSLLNRVMSRRKLVRTSRTPGATRAVNVFRVTLVEPAANIDFVDLPGYGYAKRSKKERKHWGELIEDFLRQRPGLRAVVVIVDARRGFEDDDLDFIAWLEEIGKEPILVATKLDQLTASERKLAIARIGDEAGRRVIGFSSETGDGAVELWNRLLRAAHVKA